MVQREITTTELSMINMRAKGKEETVTAILAAPLILESVTTTATYNLSERLVVAPEGELGVRLGITQVCVTSTRFIAPPEDDEGDRKPYTEASGFGRPMTSKNEPTKNEYDTWRALPVDLVAPLLGRSFTA
jgi:hypothetical protein